MSLVKKRVAVLVAMILLSIAGLFVGGSAAHAINGRVQCVTSKVVGIWIDTDGGSDGWARFTHDRDNRFASWSFDTKGKSWKAAVGCGGTPQHWGLTLHSPWTSKQGGYLTCEDVLRTGCQLT